MSILDDIGHVASEAWSHGKATAESFGGAALAGPGLVWDIATSPKDIKDDLFRALGRLTDPLANTNTFSGALAAPLIDASMTAYRQGISEPLSTAAIMASHLDAGHSGDLFDSSAWSHAYDLAQHQSIGQSFAFAFTNDKDPFDYNNPYQDVTFKDHPFLAGALSGTIDAAANWYLDPLVLAGKGAKGIKLAKTREITAVDKLAGIKAASETETTRRLGITPFKVDGLKTKFDTLTGTIDGTKHTPGWLADKDATDIYAGLRMGGQQNGRQIAGLLADTNKEQNVAKRINAQRQVLLTLAGDTGTVGGLEDDLAYVADGLKNIANGTVTGTEANAVYDNVVASLADNGFESLIPSASKAENVAEAERQLDNLPDIQQFLTSSEQFYSRLLGQQDTLKAIPSLSAAGERAVGRASGRGLLRSASGEANTGHGLADDILNRTLSRPLQSFYQHSSSHMPLRVVHGLTVKTLESGSRFTDSFRNVRPEFMLNMNDLEDVTKNVDAYARRAGMSPEQRHFYINALSTTTMPIERARIVEKVERDAKKALLVKHNIPEDLGGKDLDTFVENLMRRYHHRRTAMMTSFQGRAFSATKAAENDPRVAKIRSIARARGDEDKFEWKNWTVDQFDESGTPVHLPFLDTQDVSLMPMMPLDEVDRVLARHGKVFRATLRAWKDERYAGGADSDLKRFVGGAGTFGFEKGDLLSDKLVDVLDMVNRAWKFSALLRLGYPIRIITDDYSRALAAHGANVIIGGLGQGLRHSGDNFLRHFENQHLSAALRSEREVLKDYIGDPSVLARNKAAWGEIGDITKKLKTVKSARRVGELKARLQILKDFHPEDMSGTEARLAEIEKILDSKSYKRAKVRIGDQSLAVPVFDEQTRVPGAYQGRGAVYRALNSGQTSTAELFHLTEGSLYKSLSSTGSYKVYRAADDEGMHLEAWAEVVNHHLRNSELGEIIIKGVKGDAALTPGLNTTNSFVNFLRAEAKKIPANPSDAERARLGALTSLESHIVTRIGQQGREFEKGDAFAARLSKVDLRKAVGDPKGTMAGEPIDAWPALLDEFKAAGRPGTKEDVLAFLHTPRGREVIAKVPHQGAHPDWWSHDVERMVDDYLPSQQIRDLAKQREITAADLKAEFPDPSRRPDVHGPQADMAMGSGPRSSMVNSMLSRFYKWVGNRNDVMSRHPLFHALYKDEVARQVEHRVAVARHRGLEYTSDDIEKAAHAAREYAKKGVNKVLFEMGGTPEIAHFMRFVSPFMAPWMEGLNRWGRIVSNDPSVARRFFMVFDAPRAAGLEIDDNGNPVPRGAPITDTHYILFQLPQGLGGKDPKLYQSQFKTSETSFNMVLQGGGLFNPGFGPMVQIPVNKYAVSNPEDQTIQNSIKAVLPFGTTSDSILGMWTPGVVDAGWTLASAKFFNNHTRQYTQMQNVLWRDKLIQFELDHGHAPSQTQANDMFADAGHDVGSTAAIKFLASALSPASLQIQSKFTAQQQAFYRLQEQGRIEKKPYYWAEEQFVKQWGEAYFPLVRSSSYNESGVSSSVGTVASLKKNRALLDRVDPEMYRMIVSGEGEGAYSQTARNWLYTTAQRTGSTQTFIEQNDPRQAMTDTLTSQGWYDYNALMNRLNLRAQSQGLTSYLDSYQLQLAKKKGVSLLADKNPAWWQDYNSFSPVEYDKKLADMQTIANDPTLNADPSRTDVKALQQYLALRDWATNVLDQRGAIGGSGSPEALANRDVLSVFTRQVSRLVEGNSWFDQYMYTGYIEHDPYLLDQTALVPGGALASAA